MDDKDSRLSTFREHLLEHCFLAELLQHMWLSHDTIVEVSRSEVDAGYDLVLEANGILRHVQLKSSRVGGKTASQKVRVSLREKPSGCVIWMIFSPEESASRFSIEYRFFGGDPGKPLPSISDYKIPPHTKGNKEGYKAKRPGLRLVPKRDFKQLSGIASLSRILFGVSSAG